MTAPHTQCQPGTKTPPMSPHARAQYIWAMLKSYMLDECSLECAAVSNSDEANLINLIKNSLTEPDATLQARVDELTKALKFYASEWQANGDGDSETPGLSRTWMEPTDELHNDEGRTARRALSPSLEQEKSHG